jgi:hypothetical protein
MAGCKPLDFKRLRFGHIDEAVKVIRATALSVAKKMTCMTDIERPRAPPR